jgi:hypothetical protein
MNAMAKRDLLQQKYNTFKIHVPKIQLFVLFRNNYFSGVVRKYFYDYKTIRTIYQKI